MIRKRKGTTNLFSLLLARKSRRKKSLSKTVSARGFP
jgi:hypothetical protein